MNRTIFIAVSVFSFSFLCLTSFAQKQEPTPETGLLYRISGNGLDKPSYVFGTVHLACRDEMFSAEKLRSYIGQTERLVLEVDMDDPAEVAVLTGGLMLSSGKSFRSELTPEQFEKVSSYLRSAIGMSAEQVQTFSPLALQVLIFSSPSILGCSPPSSHEMLLTDLAKESKRPVEGLETAEFQVGIMQSIPIEKQAKMLYEMAVSPERVIKQFNELREAYRKQDSELLYEVASSQFGDYADLQAPLLDKRNEDWFPKVESMIKAKSSFIAVGGAHLGGKTGLITMLRKKGYKVEAVRL